MKSIWQRLIGRTDRAHQKSAEALLNEANNHRDRGRWHDAAQAYRHYIAIKPKRMGTHLQLGNMLKEAGDFNGAEAAYRAALAIRETPQGWTQLGQLFIRQARRNDAISAFRKALALARDFAPARAAIIDAGARNALPVPQPLTTQQAEDLAELRRSLDEIGTGIVEIGECAVVPLTAYDLFADDEILPDFPKEEDAHRPVAVYVDGRGCSPHRLRNTVLSLFGQTASDWQVSVVVDKHTLDHAVASLGVLDDRVTLYTEADDLPVADFGLVITAGTTLRADALAWFSTAARRTRAGLIYADHDVLVAGVDAKASRVFPVFHPMSDPFDLATTQHPPVVVFWQGERWSHAVKPWELLRRDVLVRAILAGDVAHLPLVLSRLPIANERARLGLPTPEEYEAGYYQSEAEPTLDLRVAPSNQEIVVIIPTRDEPGMLASCIDSLHALAERPDRLAIVVVDNRSQDTTTRNFLTEGQSNGRFTVLTADEPFNWSRLNNLAVAATHQPILLFLNNDTEILTQGWDVRLAGLLARPDVGVIGARLLYPDHMLQHGGILLGTGDGNPRHDGLGQPASEPGPLGRWARVRSAAAVTGAFMAIRRDVFERVGRFEERLMPIAYSDIDLCLKVRNLDLYVVYAGDIEVVHHESRTRGLNDTWSRTAWDSGERATIEHLWTLAFRQDPSVNPNWANAASRPFDGIRRPSRSEIMTHLDQSATSFPWHVARA